MCLDINRAIYLYKDPLVACVMSLVGYRRVEAAKLSNVAGSFPYKILCYECFGKLLEISIRIILVV